MASKKPIVLTNGTPNEIASTDTIPLGNLGSGSPSSSNFLRGDGTWDVPSGGGGGSTTFQRTVTEVTPTLGQVDFTVDYTVGYIDVFVNGIKLVVGSDFTATSGTSITLVNSSLADDNVELITYTYVPVTSANLTGDVTSVGAATTLSNTTVTPGSYTNTNLTVDSKGRITSASTGTGGSAIGETFNPFLLMGA
jgi:hypothetical protein